MADITPSRQRALGQNFVAFDFTLSAVQAVIASPGLLF
jgi:hypothetical protein